MARNRNNNRLYRTSTHRLTHDLAGRRFGRWTVLCRSEKRNLVSTSVLWDCLCDCGTKKAVVSDSLRRGLSKSCGCFVTDTNRTLNTLPPGEARRREVLATYKRTAKERGRLWELTEDEFNALFLGVCFYCGSDAPNGIDRIDNAKDYVLGNVRSCCKICNYAKNTMSESKFENWIKRVYKNLMARKTGL